MATTDKFVPVDSTAHTLSAPLPVYLGALLTAVVLAGFSSTTLVTTATYTEELAPWVRGSLTGMADLGVKSGLAGLRERLEGAASFLDETPRFFKRPLAPLVAAATPAEAAPPPEPTEPPGTRWAAHMAATRAPRRILIVGASSIQHAVGTELERELLARYDGIEVVRRGKVATGLTRPDVFDWPAEVQRLLDEVHPDLVVAQFGGNDGQNIVDAKGTPLAIYTPEWEVEYGRRLTELTNAVESTGAEFVILGMPVMRSESFTRKVRWLNDITQRFVEASGGVYVGLEDLSVDDEGHYEESVRFRGQSGRSRMDDGIHFTRLGGMYVAYHLTHRLERLARFTRKPEADGVRPASMWTFDVPSAARGRSTAFAWVPSDVPIEGLPVWYLLHGAWDSAAGWSDREHDALADLSAELGLVIVAPDGEPFGYWLDATEKPGHRLASWMLDELVPYVDLHLPSNGVRGISGLSMGGHGALTLALSRPGTFQVATSMSGVVDLTEGRTEHLEPLLGTTEEHLDAYVARSATHLLQAEPQRAENLELLITCGDKDRLLGANERLHSLLDSLSIAHTWTPSPGGHDWDVWSRELPVHAAFVADVIAPKPVAPPPEPPPMEGAEGGDAPVEPPADP